jgi:hypothetical protein
MCPDRFSSLPQFSWDSWKANDVLDPVEATPPTPERPVPARTPLAADTGPRATVSAWGPLLHALESRAECLSPVWRGRLSGGCFVRWRVTDVPADGRGPQPPATAASVPAGPAGLRPAGS